MNTQITTTSPLPAGAAGTVFQRWNTAKADPTNATRNNPAVLRTPNAPSMGTGVGTQVVPRMELLLPGEPCSIDMEFINFQVPGAVHPMDHNDESKRNKPKWAHRPAWMAITNTRGEVVLDIFVKYPYVEGVRTMIPRAEGKDFGITQERLDHANGAVPGWKAEQYCARILRNRPVVVHGGGNDLTAFQLPNPFRGATHVYHTQNEYAYEVDDIEAPGLWRLTGAFLNRVIQADGKHSPVEDPIATMEVHIRKYPYDRDEAAQKWKAVWGPPQQYHSGGYGRGRGNHGGGLSRGGSAGARGGFANARGNQTGGRVSRGNGAMSGSATPRGGLDVGRGHYQHQVNGNGNAQTSNAVPRPAVNDEW
ncbi:hypothetical protein CBER1_06981 [Cercospora berteroae]|uniref:Exonuclease domain-containing protein n=1 Tax=Cercospora berteroae TaxID=357750 RepID=A0A2S6BSB8_9PEZI|nr:hypothetical protein CBER1_06981 [Cercospora berteroae]